MSDDDRANRPSFSAPLYAALRQGSKEIAQNVLPAFPDSARPIEEPGTLGNPTPQMVTAQAGTFQSYEQMLDSYSQRLPDRSPQEHGLER